MNAGGLDGESGDDWLCWAQGWDGKGLRRHEEGGGRELGGGVG